MINTYSPYNYPSQNNQRNQRVSLRWFLYLILIGIAGFGLSFYFSSLGEDYKVRITSKEGVVEYRLDEKESWQEPEKIPLEGNNSFEARTLADGRADIEISEGSKIKMGNFSHLVLLDNQGKITWAQTDGEVHYEVSKNEKRKSYKIVLGDGEIEVLGTNFSIKVDQTDTTVYVFSGKVKATYKDKSVQEAKENEKIIINPLEKKVVAFEEKDFASSWITNDAGKVEPSLPIENSNVVEESSPTSDNTNNNTNSPASTTNANQNTNSTESISVSGEKNSNVNQNSNSITSSAVKSETEEKPKTATSSPTTTTTTTKTANSGKTTRSKCEDSGGHWTKDSGLCKCPPGENFTGGKCKRQ